MEVLEKEHKDVDMALDEDKEVSKERGEDSLQIASVGIVYTPEEIIWENIGSNKVKFVRYHQEFQKAYQQLATHIYEAFGAETQVKAFGVEIKAFGKEYFYSKDYVTGLNVMAGEDTALANYILTHADLDDKRVRGRYLTEKEAEEVRHVAVEQFIILPTEVSMRLREKLVTLTLQRPKSWIEEFTTITEMLGVEVPKMWMEQGDVLIQDGNSIKRNSIDKVLWKFDKGSVKDFINIMCKYWEKDESSNRKPKNDVIRGAGITLVNHTNEQREYRDYIDKMVKKALTKTNKVNDLYKVTYSNTTTSCYVEFTNFDLYDLKISIRDHEEMRDNGHYRFYIDAVGREDFSTRLALVIEELIRTKRDTNI